MERNTSWEANAPLVIQETPRILWKLKVHCSIYKSPPIVPTLSYINSFYATPFYAFQGVFPP